MRRITATGILVSLLMSVILICGIDSGCAAQPSKTRANAATSRGGLISVSGDSQRVTVLIHQIMAAAHSSYTIDSGLAESYATVRLKNVTVMAALAALAKTCTRPFTFRLENGIYHFALTGASNLDWQRITLDIQSTSLPGAISSLMKQAHADYVLDRDIGPTALVTMNLTSVPFQAAIDSLVQASTVPITYRVESGTSGAQIYHFMSKAKGMQQDNIASGKYRYTDSSLETDPTLTEKRVSHEFEGVYLSHALKTMLDKVPLRYEIDASVEDTLITQRLENVPLSNAISLLVKLSGQPIAYQFESDVLRFKRKGR